MSRDPHAVAATQVKRRNTGRAPAVVVALQRVGPRYAAILEHGHAGRALRTGAAGVRAVAAQHVFF